MKLEEITDISMAVRLKAIEHDHEKWKRFMNKVASELNAKISKGLLESSKRLEAVETYSHEYDKQHNHITSEIIEKMEAILLLVGNITGSIEQRKVPHKCPVCDGLGTPQTANETCNACDDDGVVWG